MSIVETGKHFYLRGNIAILNISLVGKYEKMHKFEEKDMHATSP
jgi:hypothetical protein